VVVGVLVGVGLGDGDFAGAVGAGDGATGVGVGVLCVVTGAECVVTGAAELVTGALEVCCCTAGFLAGFLACALCGLAVVVVLAVVVLLEAFVCEGAELPQPASTAAATAAISARLICLPDRFSKLRIGRW
jgi:hypothetical protein